MAWPTTADELCAGFASGIEHPFGRISVTAKGAGYPHSLWIVGGQPGAGVAPPAYTAGSGYTCDDSTAGSFPFANPAGGKLTRLFHAAASGTVAGTLVIYDRLWTCSGFSTNTTGTQTITTPGTIPARDKNAAALGDGVELWLETYTLTGSIATTNTITVAIKDQANSAVNATYNQGTSGTFIVSEMHRFVLPSGSTGVRNPVSLGMNATSGTAGDIGLTLLRRVAEIQLYGAPGQAMQDAFELGMKRIIDDTCLAMLMVASTTTTGILDGSLVMGQQV